MDAAAEEAASLNAATVEAERAPVAEAATVAAPAAVAEAVAVPEVGNQQVAEAIAEADAVVAEPAADVATTPDAASAAIAAPAALTASPSTNGASASSYDELPKELSPEEKENRDMTRRELLTYAWGGALALVGAATGVGLFLFMYPRFRAGEFGGEFFVPITEVPPVDQGPVSFSSGKFWLVQAEEEGPKALYMVCTHLGCLYKWEASNFRFECPCHGSKFSKDGFYIEGPAPRSLDRFETRVEGETLVVDTGAKITGLPAGESPARAAAS